MKENKCDKGWSDGSCCCNCANHYEDFYHCTTTEKSDIIGDGCVCSVHKGWICIPPLGESKKIAHSNCGEHGMCEMHELEKETL
ncbi:MAG TPA: hypothetical protein VIK86_05515 [Candidatus Paceibacterota bacterium]